MNFLASVVQLAARAESDPAVEAGRQALGHNRWWGYPWYDSASDGIRRIDVQTPRDWSWLRDWLPKVHFPETLLQWTAWLLLFAALGLLTFYLLRYYRDLRRRGRSTTAADEPQPDRIELLPLDLKRPRGDLLAEAGRLYRQGDFARAVLYLFAYELLELEKYHLVELARGKTNRQYLRELPRKGALRGLVEQTMVAFEDVFFGNQPLGQARFEACWSALPRFEDLLREARP